MNRKVLKIGSLAIAMLLFLSACSSGVEKVGDEAAPEENIAMQEMAAEEEPVMEESSNDEVLMDAEGTFVDMNTEIAVDAAIPAFRLETLDGGKLSSEDLIGKDVMMVYWTTWCSFCKKEMPDLQVFSEEQDDLLIIAVNVGEDKQKVQKYIDDGGYTFPVVMDYDSELSRAYLVSGFPSSYFIDKEGRLIGAIAGGLGIDSMREIQKKIVEMNR